VRRIVKRAGRRAGMDIQRLGLHSQPELRRAQLLAGGNFTVVVDVGANRGDYGRQIRQCGYRKRIVSFEPLPEPFSRLQARASTDALWDCRQLALGTESATRRLNVAANNGASSSFFDMSADLQIIDKSVRYVGCEEVQVCPLDAVADELIGPSDRVWLKIDVQGYELQVLEGARRAVEKVDGLEIEMSLVPLYDGQPLMHDVLDVVRANGFELIDLAPAYRDPESGRVLQIDGIAMRRD
jgi:FkbM family methyltransferase